MKNAEAKSGAAAKFKILSRRGETLTEVLVALLIACLAMAMLAGMIQSSVNIINSAENKIQEYYVAGNNLALKDTPDAESGTIRLSYKEGANPEVNIRLIPDDADVAVYYYTNDELSKTDVISYKRK